MQNTVPRIAPCSTMDGYSPYCDRVPRRAKLVIHITNQKKFSLDIPFDTTLLATLKMIARMCNPNDFTTLYRFADGNSKSIPLDWTVQKILDSKQYNLMNIYFQYLDKPLKQTNQQTLKIIVTPPPEEKR